MVEGRIGSIDHRPLRLLHYAAHEQFSGGVALSGYFADMGHGGDLSKQVDDLFDVSDEIASGEIIIDDLGQHDPV